MAAELPPDSPEPLPEAVVDSRRRLSLVWLIPLVAILAAGWLGYRTQAQQGPLVSISFQTAEGLEAGKTRVRYKDVEVGQVEAIELSRDLSKVVVRARLARQVDSFVTDQTRFWVVRPRFSGGQVSGLSTLVGGAYIGVDLTDKGQPARAFEGLETPPLVTANDPGSIFTLHAERLGSLSVGSPVRFRDIEVGRVVAYTLLEPETGPGGVDIQVFIHAPHDAKVRANTRFWNASGIGLILDANGVRLSTESVTSLLQGGISYGLPPGLAPGPQVADDTVFELFPNQQAAEEERYAHRETWQLEFAGSVRGLNAGAPVEFRGIRVGEVREVSLELDAATRQTRIPVLVEIEPERLHMSGEAVPGPDTDTKHQLWDQLVANGLRAQLKTGSLITGALYVDLDFYPDDPPQQIAWEQTPPQLPTVPTPLDELRGLLTRLSRLPLDRMGEDLGRSLSALRDTLEQTRVVLQRLDGETAPELNRTLAQTRQTLESMQKLLTPGSPLQSEAQRVLAELGAAARSIRVMADYLERHPEALIRGKGANP